MASARRKPVAAQAPTSGQMTAWDLADDIVEMLRERDDLVRPMLDDDGDLIACDFDDQLVREIEQAIRRQLQNGGIRP